MDWEDEALKAYEIESRVITAKKPVWSTRVVRLDGHGVIIHNYADGTNSGPLSIYVGPPFAFPIFYRRALPEMSYCDCSVHDITTPGAAHADDCPMYD